MRRGVAALTSAAIVVASLNTGLPAARAATAAPIPCAAEGVPEAPQLPMLAPFEVPSNSEVVTAGGDIAAAVDRAASGGGVVVLSNGVHPPVTISSSGPVTIVGESHDLVILQGITFDGAHDVTLRGVTVTGEPNVRHGSITVRGGSSGISLVELTVDPYHDAGVDIIEGSQDIVVRNSRITGEHVTTKKGFGRNVHIGAGTAEMDQWVSGIEIRDNELTGAAADAIQVAGAHNVVIEGNFIHDNQQNEDHNDGVQVVAVENIVIEGNVFTTLTEPSQDQSIILGHLGAGVGPPPHPNMKVRGAVVANNLIHHWRGAGITLHGTIDVLVVNNTAVDIGRDGQAFPSLLISDRYADNENVRVINNVFSNIVVRDAPADEQAHNVVEGAGAGPQDVTADPCFRDRVRYELAPSSPAVDFGTPIGAPMVDLEGRPRDGRPDAGAMELS